MEKSKIFFIKNCLIHRCKPDNNYCFKLHKRLYMTIKCCIAIILNKKADEEKIRKKTGWHPDFIEVGVYDYRKTYHHEYGEGAEWKQIGSLVKGLGYRIIDDGYP
jgi:hypothetical protein